MKVKITPLSYGFEALPVSRDIQRQMREYEAETGFPTGNSVFFQEDYELPESVQSNKRAMRELRGGFSVVVLVDPWEFGHWVGYDFSEVIHA